MPRGSCQAKLVGRVGGDLEHKPCLKGTVAAQLGWIVGMRRGCWPALSATSSNSSRQHNADFYVNSSGFDN